MTDSTRFARTGSVPGLTDTRRARHAADEATLLLIKPAENTKRMDRTALALANSYTRLMTLSEPLGKTQKQVAQDIGIAQSRFSRFLSLSKAPEEIQKVSSEDGLQDLWLLSDLRKAYDINPTATLAMLTKWRQSPDKGPLRPIVDKLLDKAPTTATAIEIRPTDTDPLLIIEVGQKRFSCPLPPHILEQLHNLRETPITIDATGEPIRARLGPTMTLSLLDQSRGPAS